MGASRLSSVLVFVAVMASSSLAHGEPTVEVSGVDAAVIATTLAGSAALAFVPTRSSKWEREPFPFDEATRGVRSTTHARIADVLVLSTLAVPVAFAAGRSDDAHAEKLVVYAETLLVAGLFTTIAKVTVQRPRPYVYGAADETRDSYVSFFSGHAATAFAGAVSGSYLYAYGNRNEAARTVLWGVEMALASATATERVRAGKHFPSDVIVGAAVGTGAGLLVTRAHLSDRSNVALSGAEWTAIGAGLAIGTTTSLLLPAWRVSSALEGLTLRPTAMGAGGGLAVSGRF